MLYWGLINTLRGARIIWICMHIHIYITIRAPVKDVFLDEPKASSIMKNLGSCCVIILSDAFHQKYGWLGDKTCIIGNPSIFPRPQQNGKLKPGNATDQYQVLLSRREQLLDSINLSYCFRTERPLTLYLIGRKTLTRALTIGFSVYSITIAIQVKFWVIFNANVRDLQILLIQSYSKVILFKTPFTWGTQWRRGSVFVFRAANPGVNLGWSFFIILAISTIPCQLGERWLCITPAVGASVKPQGTHLGFSEI